ncbi:hypothetical protein THRCLA_02230 [Thraustotheca clavata]|uniref:PX domain-containing protein n=1 Tax=Thraustotheca clavata TaxID=74557 RepID=A0A1W0A646_9STRA|nr:hypothetical protein THRCLA_02230 [Thraustotheca clavata]
MLKAFMSAPPAMDARSTKAKSVSFVHLVVRSVLPCVSSDGSYMEYDIEMANTRTGKVWNLKKRYSAFLALQRKLDDLLDASHCTYCSAVADHTADLDFPPKKWSLFHHSLVEPGIAAMRARMFCAYTSELVKIGTTKRLHACPIVADDFRHAVLSFLTTPDIFIELNKVKLSSRVKSRTKIKTLETIFEHNNSTLVLLDAASS